MSGAEQKDFIPPELTDRIIDFLHDDYRALCACAIVCSEWLPSARLHIFRDYRPRLNRDLLGRSSRIGPWIRKIQLPIYVDSTLFHEEAIAEIHKNLSNVKELLVNGSLNVVESDRPDMFCSFQHLLAVTSSLPSLRTVRFECLSIYIEENIIPEVPRSSIEVLSLKNVDWDPSSMVDRPIVAEAFSSLHTLQYSTSDSANYGSSLFRFLRHYGSHLVNIYLDELPGESSDEILEALGCLKSLQNLHIRISFSDFKVSTLKVWLSTKFSSIFGAIISTHPVKLSLNLYTLVQDDEFMILDSESRRDLIETLKKMTLELTRPQLLSFHFTLTAEPSTSEHSPRPTIQRPEGLCLLTWESKLS